MSRLLIAAGIAWGGMAVILAWWVHDNTYEANLDRLARAGTIRVEQASDRLLGQIASYRVLTNMLARHPRIFAAVRGDSSPGEAGDLLLDAALKYGAENIAVTVKSPDKFINGVSDKNIGLIHRN